jgi:hypothetical protein
MDNYPNPKEWSDLKGYDGLYQIRMIEEEPFVEIKNTSTNKLKKYRLNNDGYMDLGLWRNNKKHIKLIHRLACIQYIPNEKNKKTVNHKNGIKTDNRLENLEWATHQENITHAWENYLYNTCSGKKHHSFKHKIGVYKNDILMDVIYGRIEIKAKGFTAPCVYKTINGKQKTHKGFVFKKL